MRRAGVLAVAALAVVLGAGGGEAQAAPAPGLQIEATALPSHFAQGDESDRYEILVTNRGAVASAAGVSVRVTPISGVAVRRIRGRLWAPAGEALSCSPPTSSEVPSCELEGAVPPDGTIAIRVEVEPTAAAGKASAAIAVEEAGALLAREVLETPISTGPAPFAIGSFSFGATGADGRPYTQAGGHPYEAHLSFELASDGTGDAAATYRPARNPRDVSVILPRGFIASSAGGSRCPPRALEEARFVAGEVLVPCPAASRIGLVTVLSGLSQGAVGTYSGESALSPLYQLVPEPGHAGELGFSYQGHVVVLYLDVVFTDGRYALRVSVPGVPIVDLDGLALTIFGTPGGEGLAGGAPLLTMPTSCAAGEGGGARLELDSWEAPHEWLASETAPAPVEGCGRLTFSPRLAVSPRATPGPVQADSPAGYDLSVAVPEEEARGEGLASARVRDLAITLPPGVSLSPAATQGLLGCAAGGSSGIDLPHGTAHPDEAGEGEALGPDGLSHLAPGNCPAASSLGSVEVLSPLRESPLTGSIYLAVPGCVGGTCAGADAEAGRMLGVYLEVAGEGVVLKLAGRIEVGAGSSGSGLGPGRLRLRFDEIPDLPLSEVDLHLREGARAPLDAPPTCGSYASSATFGSWGAPEVPAASASSSFDITAGAGVDPCPASEASQPNVPLLAAGSSVPIAGAFSPFTLDLSRPDGSQRLGSVSATLPPGLLARLAGVSRCPEAALAAAEGTAAATETAAPPCPSSSRVGTVVIAAGPGSTPLRLPGEVYLAGPYQGAPFSLALVVPTLAGPFDLGTVVTRIALHLDERSAQIHAVSDPLPQMLAGIPLDLREVSLRLDRPGFTLNPTNCSEGEIDASVTSTFGDVASLRNRFQVGHCATLAFGPSLRLTLAGETRRGGHPSLRALLTRPPGESSNLRRISVNLPKGLMLAAGRPRAICTKARFAAGAVPGGSCPRASAIGSAEVWTPLLEAPERGRLYLRSSGPGRRLPDLVVALRGEVALEIIGGIGSGGRSGGGSGRLHVSFPALPDVPISRLRLDLRGGAGGLLEAGEGLCATRGPAGVRMVGQNGKVRRVHPRIAEPCGARRPGRPN